ncbi:hypothetical protein GCM10009850_102960 [Nonomuraea monospora]|uniref:Outer membrane channel protein CpnT-like N-terminal domain-containing protein n=1 Tax=Nonomuraea monospora TaxID=568818 RepID=A0ABN3CZX3_9ACTN
MALNISPGRASIYGMGTLGIAAFVFEMLATPYPEGDPDRARQAGAVWKRLADRIEESPEHTYSAAQRVWRGNDGAGVEEFKKTVTAALYPRAEGDAFTARLAKRCRDNGTACDDFAETLKAARDAYWTLALANLASFIFITTFPWQAGWAYQITQILIRRAEAGLLAKLLEHSIAKIVLSKLTEYSIGSVFFAVGDVSVVAGVKALRGEDPGSLGQNATQAVKEFAASVAFYGAFDAAMPVIRKATSNMDIQYFVSRLVGGSAGYGPTYEALNGQSGKELVPTWEQTLSRVLLYFTMAHKPAGG